MNWKKRYILVALTALLAVAYPGSSTFAAEPQMRAHFINVGQADAALLEFPCGAILIDAGAQDDTFEAALVEYLADFFGRRTDLSNTLSSVIISHNHIDHTRALRSVVSQFNVERYFDNGQLTGAGTGNPNWLRREVADGDLGCTIHTVNDVDIQAVPGRTGLTDADIDPLVCQDCDPRIVFLAGRKDTNPGWPAHEFDNKNNHSIVVRVDFGESSFLFTGDLEHDAINDLVAFYSGSAILDVDVYQVGHHGSWNGTTTGLLAAMTPEIAVVSVGHWTFGQNSANRFTTFAYGHPRWSLLADLQASIPRYRSGTIWPYVAIKARHFNPYPVRKRVYATAWDGNIIITAKLDGSMRTTRNN